ncbi:hypothetical protein R3P38DRAFT_3196363 [Favolaschia claudopus]|uniref:Uncharacterized protein n=1 Tax=Favolaschia claudopus TaxID=2862362 RepID=A0AAW0B802_9AGAR
MTNTDSLASGWELDCSTTERDIRVRRADRRRRQNGTNAKSPPIIISSDRGSSTTTSSDSSSDSSSDGTFKKAFNDWTRSRRASASNNAKTNTNTSSNQSTTTAPNAEAASSSSSTQPSDNSARAGPSRPSRVLPPPLSQTRARPTWLDPTALESDDIEDATTILRRSPTRYWQGLMREILERFPHPDPSTPG